MSTIDYDEIPKKRLGEALTAARTMIGLQEQEAADSIGISVRKLRHWESGRKAPGPDMAEAIGRTYGLDLGGNLPPRIPIVFDADAGGVIIADRVVAYTPGVSDNDDFLEGYVAVVRDLRGLDPETPIQLRSTDIQVLATVLDLTDNDLEDRLAFWMGQPPGSMVGVRHRLVLAAVVVGVVGGATVGAFMVDAPTAEAADSGPAIEQTFDGDDGPEPDADPFGPDGVDIANASVVEMELDDDDGGLVLDFSALQGEGDAPTFELDLSALDLDLEVEDEEPEPEPEPEPEAEPEPEPQAEPEPEPEPQPEPEAAADAEPQPELEAEPPAEADEAATAFAPALDAEDDEPGDDDVALEVAGTPTVDDWLAEGVLDEGDVNFVDMLELVEDDGEVSGVEPEAEPETDPEPETEPEPDPEPEPEAEAPDGENWDFDGTREWVRQNLDGGWVDGWQGDGVALTGTELWEASEGDTSVDLNGDGPGWFGRTIDTVEGETYEISFDMSGNPHGQRGEKSLNLTAGDEVASFTFDTTDISRNDMQWETVSMTFVADGDSTWVSFDSTTPGSVGAVIDNINVAPAG
ncbi:MAG: DUF642 domain-containing protein [Actinomycetota bacterium]